MTALVLPVEHELESGSNTEVHFVYAAKSYQEIRNREDFGFESFWSSVGGFIGIFMGYSLLQIPELLKHLPSFLRSLKLTFLRRCEPEQREN